MIMRNKDYLSALQCLLDNQNLTCDVFRAKYPHVADDIICTLRNNKAITFLTDGTIWHVDRSEVNVLIEYYKDNSSLSNLIKDNWKTCLEVLVAIATIVGVLVTLL